jgi:hypothetical protein
MSLRGRSVSGMFLIALLFLLLTPLFAIFVNVRKNSVRVADITDDDICLDGVSAQFIMAVDEQRSANAKRGSLHGPPQFRVSGLITAVVLLDQRLFFSCQSGPAAS